jgi:hypothetical protein
MQFSFDYRILESCATDRTASKPLRSSSSSSKHASSAACQDLYQEYRRHYYRREFSGDRFHKFQEMVQLIYNHNNNNNNNHSHSDHYLTLNQFSDDLNFPISNTTWQDDSDDSDDSDDKDDFAVWKNQLRRQDREAPDFTALDDEEWKMMIRHRGLKGHHHRKKYQSIVIKKQKTRKAEQPPPTLSWHHYVSDQPFNVVNLPKKGIGVEMDIKPTNHFKKEVADSGEDENADTFAKSLNWATKDNPDEVPLVHDVFDQVRT